MKYVVNLKVFLEVQFLKIMHILQNSWVYNQNI